MPRVLVIDDSKIIRDLLVDFLTEEGHEVVAVGESDDGIQHAVGGTFDICFCDLHIPRKNGWEIFCEVSAVRPDLQFVFTDSMPDQLADNVQRAGARFCLRKPFDLTQLREVLQKLTSRARVT